LFTSPMSTTSSPISPNNSSCHSLNIDPHHNDVVSLYGGVSSILCEYVAVY
jgi:hypothetical protein